MKANRIILSALAVTLAGMTAGAQDIAKYSYVTDLNNIEYYGSGLKENYDVAIFLDNPAFVGAKIQSITVPLPGSVEDYTAMTGWMSTELKLNSKKANDPDIAQVEATLIDGNLTATFAEPYTLTSAGVYVGYSISLAKLTDDTKAPVAIGGGDNANGFFIHSSRRQLKWKNMVNYSIEPVQSAMIVTLDGNFPPNSASVSFQANNVVKTGEEITLPVYVVNGGTSEISSVDYEWSVAGQSGSGTWTFNPAIAGVLGTLKPVTLTMPAIGESASQTLKVNVSKVNGVANNSPVTETSTTLYVTESIPVYRPLVEEYTGTWCGFCPRGYVALEDLNDMYGDMFVAAAWHDGDPMAFAARYPSSVAGFPDAYINRSVELDPGDLYEAWPPYLKKDTKISVDVDIRWADDSQEVLEAEATVNSLEDMPDSNCKLSFLLVADELKGPEDKQNPDYNSWLQSNYFGGTTAYGILPGELGQFFFASSQKVAGLVYNDVVAATSAVKGEANSLPATLTGYKPESYTYSFNIAEALNTAGAAIVQNKEKVRVIAILYSGDGEILNCNTSMYTDGSYKPFTEVKGIAVDNAEVVESVYYDLNGVRVNENAKGLVICVDRLANGKLKATKIMK